MGEAEEGGNLVFAINGERFELPTINPSTTLLEFIRTRTRYKGPKLGCGEGGCGACVVLLSKYDPVLEQIEHFTVSSCLTLLCSINGGSITTTEGLGNSKDGYHAIHKRFSGFHASQCGFCTPGMCMSLFSALTNAEKTQRPEPSPGFSKIMVSEAEKAIAGNLCRCTGYRPIADACKSFAADVDMEDLGMNSFWRKGENNDIKVSRLPLYTPSNENFLFPEFLRREVKSKNLLDSKRYSWYNPISMEELMCLLESEVAGSGTPVKLVVGNTGMGYYKEIECYDKYIDLRHIPELSMVKRDSMGIEFGATVTISRAIQVLKEESNSKYRSNREIFKKIADHMDKVASGFIRNSASLGGNLVMAQKNQFPSDIATILLAAGSLVEIQTGSLRLKLTLEEFLERPPLDSKTVLASVRIPGCQNSYAESDTKLLFETYRAAPRPLGNALPYLNAAFMLQASPCKTSNGIFLGRIHLAFGAYGIKHAIRARKVEEFLSKKLFSVGILYEAMQLLKAFVVPEDGISDHGYRSSLAVGFLFDFFGPLIESSAEIPNSGLNGCGNNLSTNASEPVNGYLFSGEPPLLSSGKQIIEVSREYHPVGEPTKKAGAEIQASGEAVYVDDIPSPKDCLHGAFINSTKPLAWVKGIRLNSSFQYGVTEVISFKDIPRGGENVGCDSPFGTEPLFADDLTCHAGQPLGFVVAGTQKDADLAANCVDVDYDFENLEAPILSLEEAVERSSLFEVPPGINPKQIGDFSKGIAEANHKILSAEIKLGSEYHFYMETQTALAVPDEDNCMVVYTSTQSPEFTQRTVARCLGVPGHNVRVITRRVGGGFGGKAFKALHVATACALAAHKFQRPVRTYLNRKTDMTMVGGRHPMKINYSVGFKSSGKITALHLDILINAGIYKDVSPLMPQNIVSALKKYNWGALSFNIKVCKTNQLSKSAMRAPGEVQGSFIAETVIEHVASALSMEVDSVRKENLHTFKSLRLFYEASAGEPLEYTLPPILDKLANSASFNKRSELVRCFNSSNKWHKRGISLIPIFYEVKLSPTPGKVSILHDGSIVVEVGGVELGQGLWTKVKQMTAFALSLLQCDGSADLLERVRVIQVDTLSLVQGGMTSGSTTSESSCEAVRICCNALVERLMPLKERLQEQMDGVTWDVLILQANLQAVNLSASSYYVPDTTSNQYLNYGAAVSEVEINLLTGAITILQVDIMYDCGQSLNPAVDLGQIEGAFVQGIGFFILEEYLTNPDGLVVSEGTWTYKIPTIDTIPKRLNVEILNSGHHQKRVLSSKASGEPPLLMAASVHCAARAAIKAAREQLLSWGGSDESDGSYLTFQLAVPATMPVVKELCGLDIVERYLQKLLPH